MRVNQHQNYNNHQLRKQSNI